MEPERSLQHSQEPSTCPYPESHRFSPCRDIQLPDILKFSSHRRLLYQITTDKFTPVLLSHNFIKAMRHCSMFQLLKSHLQEYNWYIPAASSTKWVTICKVQLRVYCVLIIAESYRCATQYTLHIKLNCACGDSFVGARGGAVGWGTALQTMRSRFRFLIVSMEFVIDVILPSALWP
jgi:hypothetical protein